MKILFFSVQVVFFVGKIDASKNAFLALHQ